MLEKILLVKLLKLMFPGQ